MLGSLFAGFMQGYKFADEIFKDVELRDELKELRKEYEAKQPKGDWSARDLKQTRDALLTGGGGVPDSTTTALPPATSGSEASTRERVERPAALPEPPPPKPIITPMIEGFPTDYDASAAAAGRAVTPLPVGAPAVASAASAAPAARATGLGPVIGAPPAVAPQEPAFMPYVRQGWEALTAPPPPSAAPPAINYGQPGLIRPGAGVVGPTAPAARAAIPTSPMPAAPASGRVVYDSAGNVIGFDPTRPP